MDPISGKKVLVTGVTGWVGGPVATQLADAGNEVYGAARFKNPAQRAPLEAAGVTPIAIDFETSSFDEVPSDLDLVLHFAVSKSNVFSEAMRSTAEGVADLMDAAAARSDRLAAFLHCSSTAVYQPKGHDALVESDPLGDSHRAMGMVTYSISKIAAEATVSLTSRRLGLPTVIARLNVPYGDTYGWMLFHLLMMERGMAIQVYEDQPNSYNPIHADDQVASLPYLLSMASTPATAVNWCGPDVVSIEDWCGYYGELTGLQATFQPTAAAIPSVVCDHAKLDATGFRCAVGWRDGLRRQVASNRPDLLKS